MRYIGLDLGNRTCGVAVSDIGGIIATSYTTIRFFEKDLNKCLNDLLVIINEKKPDKIVMGYPLNMNGTLGPQGEYVLEFKRMLNEAVDLEVILYDERLTTVEVQKVMISADVKRNKRKKVVDTLAATLILQSYLDSISRLS